MLTLTCSFHRWRRLLNAFNYINRLFFRNEASLQSEAQLWAKRRGAEMFWWYFVKCQYSQCNHSRCARVLKTDCVSAYRACSCWKATCSCERTAFARKWLSRPVRRAQWPIALTLYVIHFFRIFPCSMLDPNLLFGGLVGKKSSAKLQCLQYDVRHTVWNQEKESSFYRFNDSFLGSTAPRYPLGFPLFPNRFIRHHFKQAYHSSLRSSRLNVISYCSLVCLFFTFTSFIPKLTATSDKTSVSDSPHHSDISLLANL